MNPEIKARWVAKLRSGIPQLEGYLGNLLGARCCLGVLCDIAVEEGVIPTPLVDEDLLIYGKSNEGNSSLLPRSVTEWAALSEDRFLPNDEDLKQWLTNGYNATASRYLTQLNDGGLSFEVIADTIERHF